MNTITFKTSQLETQLGTMVTVADDKHLYLLDFVDRRALKHQLERLQQKTKLTITSGKTKPIELIEHEIQQYFAGKLIRFKTPLKTIGTPFQQRVWEELTRIPHGETRSYLEIAKAIGKPTAFRAVALANSMNRLAIIVPCHRVINANGKLGGYAGGVNKKEWLLAHENRHPPTL